MSWRGHVLTDKDRSCRDQPEVLAGSGTRDWQTRVRSGRQAPYIHWQAGIGMLRSEGTAGWNLLAKGESANRPTCSGLPTSEV